MPVYTSLVAAEEFDLGHATTGAMGRLYEPDKKEYGLPKAKTPWGKFIKMYVPNFGYKGTHRKKEGRGEMEWTDE